VPHLLLDRLLLLLPVPLLLVVVHLLLLPVLPLLDVCKYT
jgi:hypothetical protein